MLATSAAPAPTHTPDQTPTHLTGAIAATAIAAQKGIHRMTHIRRLTILAIALVTATALAAGAASARQLAVDPVTVQPNTPTVGDGTVHVTSADLAALGYEGFADNEGLWLDSTEWNDMQDSAPYVTAVYRAEAPVAASKRPAIDVATDSFGGDFYKRYRFRTTVAKRLTSVSCVNNSATGTGDCTLQRSKSVGTSVGSSFGLQAWIIAFGLNADISTTETVALSYTAQVPPRTCKRVVAYGIWHRKYYELWEDDIWHDDYLGLIWRQDFEEQRYAEYT